MAKLLESTTQPLKVHSPKRLSGPFAIMDDLNENGRVYPEKVYLPAYESIFPKIKSRRLLGELDHPLEYDEIRLSNVSHVIVESHIEENASGKKVVYGTVELLDTPAGKLAQALVRAGIPLGISSRGLGNTKRIKEGSEVTEFKLITYDLVAEPSFKIAILSEENKNLLSESLSEIESKLPLNESHNDEYESIRESIRNIRESLCLTRQSVNIDKQKIQTMEVSALRSLIESKISIIKDKDEAIRIQESKTRKALKRAETLSNKYEKLDTRYTTLRESYTALQDSYNELKETSEIESQELLESKNAEILRLQMELAVERRGMSMSKVGPLLEGISSAEEIESRLDSITTINRRSSTLESLKEERSEDRKSYRRTGNRLANIISKV